MVRAFVALVGVLSLGLAGCGSGGSHTSTPRAERDRAQTQSAARNDALVLDDGLSRILTVDPESHAIRTRPVTIADSFHVALLANDTVVLAADDSTVRVTPLAGGAVRVLGSGLPIAGTEPGTFWITGVSSTVRRFAAGGRVLREVPGPPIGPGEGACLTCPKVAVAAVPGALVFQSTTGFDVWDTETRRITRHLGNTPSYAGPAFGSTLPWCTDCKRTLDLTDVATGQTREVALSIDGAADALASARWSPDGTKLAIPEQVDPGQTAAVILVDVASGRATELKTAGQSASVAWSNDGHRLYVAAANPHGTRLTVRDFDAGTSEVIETIPGPALHLAAVL